MKFLTFKAPKLATEISHGNQSANAKYTVQNNKKPSEQITEDLDNSTDDSTSDTSEAENVSNTELCNIIGSQREESNAFQLLMNRSKPIQYKLLPPQFVEEKFDNIKGLRSKHKEKLIALADKRGYSKKKIAEMEEGEKIEQNIENRMRFFKSNIVNDNMPKRDDNIELSIKNNKQQSGNLLDYFR